MPTNYLSITYSVDIWVLNSAAGDVLAMHGELEPLMRCAFYFAKETCATLKVFNINGIVDTVYRYEDYITNIKHAV